MSEKEFYYSKVGRDFVFPGYKEKYPRSKSYLLKHVKFEGELDYPSKSLRGSASLSLLVLEDGGIIELDAVDFKLLGVSLNGKPAGYTYDGRKIVVSPGLSAGSEVRLDVDYVVREPKKGLFFIVPDADHPERQYQAWTQGESEDNRYWLPVYDYPNIKCTSEVILRVPANQLVVSNGVLLEVRDEGEKKRYHWYMKHPHSTYLISFVAGEFDSKEERVDDVTLQYFVPKGRGGDIDRSFSKTPDMLRFFGEFTGVPYPYEKYAQTCVFGFTYGGMENISATTLTERTLHDEVAHMDFSSDGLVAHELAHQWFGDLVTCKDWSHIWLNESFATFFQALYFRRDRGVDEYYYDLIGKLDTYLEESSKRYIRPISTKFYSMPEEVFDRHAYEKGSLVLNSLLNLTGEETFRKAIKLYLERHRFANAETDDLRRAFEDVTSKDLEWFFDQWVYSAGHPQLRVSYTYDERSKLLRVLFKQTQQDVGAYRVPIELVVNMGDTRREFRVELDGREHTFVCPCEAKPKYVCVDPKLSVVGTLEVEEDEASAIAKAKEDDHLYCRVVAIRGLSKNASIGVVEALEELLLSHGFWGVSAEAAFSLGSIGTKRALEALLKGVRHDHPKVRRAVAKALGRFKENEAYQALVSLLNSDPSYYVRGEAALSLGKTRVKEAFEQLLKAVETPSHADVIASNALQGLAELRDERGVELLIEKTAPKYSEMLRRSAAQSLYAYISNDKVRDRIVQLLEDADYGVRMSALQAIEKSGDIRFLSHVSRVVEKDADNRVVRTAMEVRLRLSRVQQDQLGELRSKYEQLSEENRRLRSEVEELKARLK
ncbi:MAG: M1 family aminopeptidase [Thermoprotei archaeon]